MLNDSASLSNIPHVPLFGSETRDQHFQFSCGYVGARLQEYFHKPGPSTAAKQLPHPGQCQPEVCGSEMETLSPVPGCGCSSGSSRHPAWNIVPAGREGSLEGRGWMPGPVASAAGVWARHHVSSVGNNWGPLGVTGQLVVRSSPGNQALA